MAGKIEEYFKASGRVLKEDSSYVNIADLIESISNSIGSGGLTDAELRASPVETSGRPMWQTIWQGNIPPGGSFPSGSAVSVHPVMNTEPNVADSGWIRSGVDDDLGNEIEQWINQRFVMGGDVALNAYVMNANDVAGSGITNKDQYFLSTQANEERSVGGRFFGKYFRVLVENTSGSTLTRANINAQGGTGTPTGLVTSLDQPLFDQIPAEAVRAVGAGKTPDDLYENVVLGGQKTLSPVPAPLGISAPYLSTAMDTDKYPSVYVLLAADQASAQDGFRLEWSDTEAFTVTRSSESYTFRQGNITDGLIVPTRTRARWLRLRYTNGLIAQGRFFISLRLSPIPLAQEFSLKPMRRGQSGQAAVTLSPTKIATIAFPGRQAISIKNLSASARPIYYGFSLGLTVLNGNELAVGESIDMDLDEFVEIYVVTTSLGGGGDRVAWTEVG